MTRKITFMTAINEALDQAMERNSKIILLGEDIAGGAAVEHLAEKNQEAWGGVFGLTKGLMPKYGRERVIDTPISEMGYIGMSVGAAAAGLHPVPELMFNDFLGFCLDPILAQGSKMRYMFGGKAKIPMTVRTCYGAGVSAAAQHSGSYYGLLGSIPGVKVVVPSNPYDAKGLLLAALEEDNIVFFFEDKVLYTMKGEVPEEYYTVEIGKAKVIKEGSDLTIVAIGKMVQQASAAAKDLESKGISVEVIDLATVAPWDEETVLASVKKTGHLVVVDESNPHNNTATDVAAVVAEKAFDSLKAPVRTICAPNTPVPFAVNLEKIYIPSAERIAAVSAEIVETVKV